MANPSNDEQNTWEENLPQALNEKHEQTMMYIKNSEVQEQYLQTNLQNLNQSDEDYSYKSTQIKTMIDDLVAMRLGLLTDLKTVYKSAQKDTSASRNNLANQLTVNNIIKSEKENVENEIERLEKNELNKKRLVELGEYEYDRYTSHKNIYKVVAYGALAIMVIVLCKSTFKFIPSGVAIIAIVAIIALVLITIGRRMLVNFSRTNLNWQKFNYDGYKGTGEGIKDKHQEKNKQSVFNNICNTISDKTSSTMNSLRQAGNRAEAKINTNLYINEEESFRNIVTDSDPKHSESFYNIQ